MKKVLFATTALVATAGMASADVATTAAAGAGYYDEGSDRGMYNFVELTFTLTGETDNGLTFGGSVSLDVGDKFDVGDFEFDSSFDGEGGFDSLFISGAFGTITFDREGTDNLYDTGNQSSDTMDVLYEYEMSGFTFALSFNAEETSPGSGDHWSFMLGYDMAPFSASIAADDTESYVINLGYVVTPEITLGLEYDNPNGSDAVHTISADYDNGMISAGIEFDSESDWTLTLGYTADGITLGGEVDEDHDWEVTGEYDLGGGLVILSGLNSDEVFYLGAGMSF